MCRGGLEQCHDVHVRLCPHDFINLTGLYSTMLDVICTSFSTVICCFNYKILIRLFGPSYCFISKWSNYSVQILLLFRYHYKDIFYITCHISHTPIITYSHCLRRNGVSGSWLRFKISLRTPDVIRLTRRKRISSNYVNLSVLAVNKANNSIYKTSLSSLKSTVYKC